MWHECMSLKLMLLNCYYMLFVFVSQAWTWSSALSGTATAFKTFKLHCDHLRHLSSCRDDGWIMLDQPSCYSLQAACSRHSRLTSPDNLMRIGMNRVRPACTSGSPFAMKYMKYIYIYEIYEIGVVICFHSVVSQICVRIACTLNLQNRCSICSIASEGILAWDSVRVLFDQHRVHSLFLLPLDCRRDVSWQILRQAK